MVLIFVLLYVYCSMLNTVPLDDNECLCIFKFLSNPLSFIFLRFIGRSLMQMVPRFIVMSNKRCTLRGEVSPGTNQ